MPGNADPSRIHHDPALTDRRGDPTGLVAFAFLSILVAAFAVVAFVLMSVPLAPAPTSRPPGTPGILATTRPTPNPAPTGVATVVPDPSAGPSAEPEVTAGPGETRDPRATIAPLPSREPAPSPTEPSGRPAVRGVMGETIPMFIDGRRVGGVVVESFQVGELPGVDLPAGARIMVLSVRYLTAFGMSYDAADWVVVDADGTRYPSLGDRAPAPALESGRIAAGESITGNVAFIRERRVAIEELVLTDGAGRDLVIVDRTSAP